MAKDLLSRLQQDTQSGQFWNNRGDDGVEREKQLLIVFFAASAGGLLSDTGRDMKTSHKDMKISENDCPGFFRFLNGTLDVFRFHRKSQEGSWLSSSVQRQISVKGKVNVTC